MYKTLAVISCSQCANGESCDVKITCLTFYTTVVWLLYIVIWPDLQLSSMMTGHLGPKRFVTQMVFLPLFQGSMHRSVEWDSWKSSFTCVYCSFFQCISRHHLSSNAYLFTLYTFLEFATCHAVLSLVCRVWVFIWQHFCERQSCKFQKSLFEKWI